MEIEKENNPIQKYLIIILVVLILGIVIFFATDIGKNIKEYAQKNTLNIFIIFIIIFIIILFIIIFFSRRSTYMSPDLMLMKFCETHDAIARGIMYENIDKKSIRLAYPQNSCAFCFRLTATNTYFSILLLWDGLLLKFQKCRTCYSSDMELEKMASTELSFTELKKAFEEKKEIIEEAIE